MAKKIKKTKPKSTFSASAPHNTAIPKPIEVNSLLDIMQDGHEYSSIVSHLPTGGQIIPDLQRAIKDVESVRGRPCVCYVANVIQQLPTTGIEFNDDLPFNEMLSRIGSEHKNIDIFLVTPGGVGQQVSHFVNALRLRFNSVEFILPYMCMSAGTLWALSGNKIWMDKRAFIGPIDPQVRTKAGDLVPAQSILILLSKIKEEGEKALKNGQNPPWHYIRLIDVMDGRQVGDAISLSNYSIKIASDFLDKYKFQDWDKHSSTGMPVTNEERKERALWVAEKLCSNDHWKSHGHGISRETANSELKLQIDPIESELGLESAIRRLWALFYYTLDKSPITKMFLSNNYVLIRQTQIKEG